MAEEGAAIQASSMVAGSRWLPALKVANIYAVFAALWIIFSDMVIDGLALNKQMVSMLQTWKGLFFVCITAILVFMLVMFYFQRQFHLIDELKASRQQLNLILDSIPRWHSGKRSGGSH